MDLTEARTQIDAIDQRILELFVQRLEVVERIGAYKRLNGLDVFDPLREATLLRTAAAAGGEKFADCTRCLMEDMMAISRDYQVEQLRRYAKD